MDFKLEPFLAMLAGYNQHVWPLQAVAYGLGVLSVCIAVRTFNGSSKIVSLVLSFFWLWNGAVFGIFYWGPEYAPAYLFSALLVVQGIFFLVSGVFRSDLTFKCKSDGYSISGLVFIVYALAGYQFFGYFLGHRYPVFFPPGLVPCPTNIFTIGILLLTDKKLPRHLMVIPVLWSLSGFMPVAKGILEDIGMIATGVLGAVLILARDRKRSER